MDEKKHICEKTGEKLTYMSMNGLISFRVHEHRGMQECDMDSLRGGETKRAGKD